MSPVQLPERPLDRVASIKVKLGVLVAASIVVTAFVAWVGERADVPAWISVPVTIALALIVTQWLARGMVAPILEMTTAVRRMAAGDWSVRVTATSNDEVGELARAFTAMSADLADVDAQRRQLVSTVSHELRTPLAAQRAVLENLADGVVEPDPHTLGVALAQAERLSALVEDLLDLSRIDGGATRLHLQRVEVRPLLAAAVDEAGLAARDVRVELVVEPTSLTVTADPARLSQVVANLLDNAIRHSPAGGAVRLVAREEAPGPEGSWSLEVSDEGPGIEPARRSAVFERFGTGDAPGGGTGLGLAIARWVSELHGGTIRALDPLPGPASAAVGARLRLDLPTTPTTALGASPTPAAPAGGAPHTPTSELTPSTPPPSTTTAPPRPEASMSATSATPPTSASPSTSISTATNRTNPDARIGDQRPLMDTVFGAFWPERDGTPRPRVLLAAAGIGLLAALTLPYHDIGLAAYVVLLLSGALVLTVSAHRRDRFTVVAAALSVALGALVVLRDDPGLGFLAVATSGVLVTTALTRAHGLPAIVVSTWAWVLAGLRGLPLLGRSLTVMSQRARLWAALRTALISVVLVVVFGALFASADAVFGSWVQAVLPVWEWESFTFRAFTWFLITGVVLAAAYLAINPARTDLVALPAGQPVRRAWEWLVPVGAVVVLVAGFVVAQAAALFGGAGYVRRTAGLTYAEYVHQGFGQLTLATMLTLLVVAVAVRKAGRATARDRLLVRVTLGLLCGLTLVVVASALHRMAAYQDAYGTTTLRLWVVAFEAWLGGVLVLLTVAGVRLAGRWVPRAALLTGAALVLGIGLVGPSGWVARHNLERYAETGRLDTTYLALLGDDAVPAIAKARLPEATKRCLLSAPTPPIHPSEWNLARARAHDVRVEGGWSTGPGGSGVAGGAGSTGSPTTDPASAPDPYSCPPLGE